MRDAKGRFLKGFDPKRHKFSHAECVDGFWAMLASIQDRYPNAIIKGNRHMSCYALPYLVQRKNGK